MQAHAPGFRVALIEAGPSDRQFPVNLKTTLPIGNILLLPRARYNWQHSFTGDASVDHRSIGCPRGKLFGGCSSVNGSVYIRGHRLDYDERAALGNPGWGFDEVLPVFRSHENHHGGASALHGKPEGSRRVHEGPVSCRSDPACDGAERVRHASGEQPNWVPNHRVNALCVV